MGIRSLNSTVVDQESKIVSWSTTYRVLGQADMDGANNQKEENHGNDAADTYPNLLAPPEEELLAPYHCPDSHNPTERCPLASMPPSAIRRPKLDTPRECAERVGSKPQPHTQCAPRQAATSAASRVAVTVLHHS